MEPHIAQGDLTLATLRKPAVQNGFAELGSLDVAPPHAVSPLQEGGRAGLGFTTSLRATKRLLPKADEKMCSTQRLELVIDDQGGDPY